jgi:PAS domain S-box-containing protein
VSKARKRQPRKSEVANLRSRITELEDTLRAIRMGEVDAMLVAGPEGDQVFTLQGAEHPYRLMVETIDEGAATLSEDGTILYANKSFAQIFDVPLQSFIGSALHAYVTGDDHVLLKDLIAEANHKVIRGEIRVNTENHRPRTIRLTLSPVHDTGVQTICVVATELTELIETNEALRVSEMSLRQLSARLLRLQDEERRRIARDLHDITGQEIVVLSMALDRLKRTIDTKDLAIANTVAEARDVVRTIGEEIRTLSYLLHPPLLDECGLASAMRWYAEGFTKRSGIKLTVETNAESLRLPSEMETALFRVVQESLTNVHRYSGSAHAELRLIVEAGEVRLEIIDHGKGMKEGSQRAALGGAPIFGVGIPGMRERLRQLGGHLDVEFGISGTRVIATLPAPAQSASEAEVQPLAVLSLSATRKRILIADDHEVMRQGLRGLVESQEQWAVCGEAMEGHEAVRKTLELRPDLVILDINLPGLSGIDAALQILQDDPSSKILFFTVHDSRQVSREIAGIGARGYVSKSRAGKDLVEAVRTILEGDTFFPNAALAAS